MRNGRNWRLALAIGCLKYLSHYAWVRRWYGGHWERWYVDFPVCSTMWFPVERCSYPDGLLAFPLLKGSPTCEDYPC